MFKLRTSSYELAVVTNSSGEEDENDDVFSKRDSHLLKTPDLSLPKSVTLEIPGETDVDSLFDSESKSEPPSKGSEMAAVEPRTSPSSVSGSPGTTPDADNVSDGDKPVPARPAPLPPKMRKSRPPIVPRKSKPSLHSPAGEPRLSDLSLTPVPPSRAVSLDDYVPMPTRKAPLPPPGVPKDIPPRSPTVPTSVMHAETSVDDAWSGVQESRPSRPPRQASDAEQTSSAVHAGAAKAAAGRPKSEAYDDQQYLKPLLEDEDTETEKTNQKEKTEVKQESAGSSENIKLPTKKEKKRTSIAGLFSHMKDSISSGFHTVSGRKSARKTADVTSFYFSTDQLDEISSHIETQKRMSVISSSSSTSSIDTQTMNRTRSSTSPDSLDSVDSAVADVSSSSKKHSPMRERAHTGGKLGKFNITTSSRTKVFVKSNNDAAAGILRMESAPESRPALSTSASADSLSTMAVEKPATQSIPPVGKLVKASSIEGTAAIGPTFLQIPSASKHDAATPEAKTVIVSSATNCELETHQSSEKTTLASDTNNRPTSHTSSEEGTIHAVSSSDAVASKSTADGQVETNIVNSGILTSCVNGQITTTFSTSPVTELSKEDISTEKASSDPEEKTEESPSQSCAVEMAEVVQGTLSEDVYKSMDLNVKKTQEKTGDDKVADKVDSSDEATNTTDSSIVNLDDVKSLGKEKDEKPGTTDIESKEISLNVKNDNKADSSVTNASVNAEDEEPVPVAPPRLKRKSRKSRGMSPSEGGRTYVPSRNSIEHQMDMQFKDEGVGSDYILPDVFDEITKSAKKKGTQSDVESDDSDYIYPNIKQSAEAETNTNMSEHVKQKTDTESGAEAAVVDTKVKPNADRALPPPPPCMGKKTNQLLKSQSVDNTDDTAGCSIYDEVIIREDFDRTEPSRHTLPERRPSNKRERRSSSGEIEEVDSYIDMDKGMKGMVNSGSVLSDTSVNSGFSSTGYSHESGVSDDESEKEEDETEEVKQERRRKKLFFIAKEIMTSEQSFVDDLILLSKDLRDAAYRVSKMLGMPIVPGQVLDQILRYLPELLQLNQSILQDLHGRINNWEKVPKVADIFVKKGPFLKLYVSYIREFEISTALLDDAIKKYPDFAKLIKDFESGPRCANLAVKHYMLRPIQRIPQYRLLLLDYLKHQDEDSIDYKDTQTALTIVSEVADHANESMQYGHNCKKLLEIQNNLIGQFEVVRPGRYLIKEGTLNKLSRKEMQPRTFFLLNDVLLYTTPLTTGYRLNNALPLTGMRVSKPSKEDFQNEFSIHSTQRSFTILAQTAEERDSWLETLEKAIQENAEKRFSFQVANAQNVHVEPAKDFKLGACAPVWIPDARVSMCMLCTAEFTVTFRRHHCRACGKVVCTFCSDYHAPLRYLKFKVMRVCITCYDQLMKETKNMEEYADRKTEGDSFSKTSLLAKFKGIRFGSGRKSLGPRQRPAVLKVPANAEDANMSGYLKQWSGRKWKKLWFVLKEKVLYIYKASEDAAASESKVLLGYEVRHYAKFFEGVEPSLLFELIHKGTSPMIFRTESQLSRDRWVKAIVKATVPDP